MQQNIPTIHQIRNFLQFTKNYFRRNNPVVAFVNSISQSLKEWLLLGKKKKMAHYRLAYQLNKLNEMEQLIATSNEHNFLKGQKFNTMR